MPRILHTMLRVSNMENSIDFYTQVLGMRILRRLHQEKEKYSLCFLGYDEERISSVIELTYNYDVKDYTFGNAYGHIAIGVKDIHRTCIEIQANGISLDMEPTPLNGSDEIIAFLHDPDGYSIELIGRPKSWLV